MKRNTGTLVLSIMVIATVVGMSATASFAQAGGRLVGTWDAQVTLRDCATGDPLPIPIPTFASIANFNQGGTFLGSTSGQPQSARTPEHGVWRHVAKNMYEFKFKSFNFGPTGAPVSYVIVRHDLELNETGDAYISSGEARFYSMNGTQVNQGCSSGVGTRFDF